MGFSDIRKLRDSVQSQSITCKNENNDFMPYSSVAQLIENHPVCKIMKISYTEIHRSLAYIFTKYKKIPKKTYDTTERFNKYAKCTHCLQAKVSVDVRQGHYVCGNCGSVHNAKIFGDMLPVKTTEEDLRALDNTIECNIPKWTFANNAFGEAWWEITIGAEIEHWNHYANIPTDDLLFVKRVALMMNKRASDNSRVAAGYCMQYLYSNYDIDKLDFTQDIIKYDLVQLNKTQKNEKVNMTRDKMVCNFQQRKSRQQWSLVSNKKQKIKIIE